MISMQHGVGETRMHGFPNKRCSASASLHPSPRGSSAASANSVSPERSNSTFFCGLVSSLGFSRCSVDNCRACTHTMFGVPLVPHATRGSTYVSNRHGSCFPSPTVQQSWKESWKLQAQTITTPHPDVCIVAACQHEATDQIMRWTRGSTVQIHARCCTPTDGRGPVSK